MKSTLVKDGDRVCSNRHREGWLCTRTWQHRGDHHAHADSEEDPVKIWRGGRSAWEQGTS